MDLDETMVENMDDAVADDTLEEDGVIEEEDESETEDLSSLTDAAEEQEHAEEQPKQEPKAKEPGYVKQRIDKAVQKAIAETRAEMQAEFDRQMAPIREKMLTDEAKELVKQGEFKSLERAKEYLQLKQGIAPNTQPEKQPEQQPRNDKGQYAPKEDPATTARIRMLAHQADKIKASRGIDVISEYNNNPEIQKKIISGEMDFYDVADQMKGTKRNPPAPMRSPNGASGHSPNAIENMSSEQFKRMEKRISEGARISLR